MDGQLTREDASKSKIPSNPFFNLRFPMEFQRPFDRPGHNALSDYANPSVLPPHVTRDSTRQVVDTVDDVVAKDQSSLGGIPIVSEDQGGPKTVLDAPENLRGIEIYERIIPTPTDRMPTAVNRMAIEAPFATVPIQQARQVCIRPSGGYRGLTTSPNNFAVGVAPLENTSVFISDLPPTATIKDLLGAVRGIGKIWASNMIPPQGTHVWAAAKVVFWNRAGLEAFWEFQTAGKFLVNGTQPKVVMNRHRSGSFNESSASRVLIITGPTDLIDQRYLSSIFGTCFTFDIDEIIDHGVTWSHQDGEMNLVAVRTLEFRFASYRAQAAWAFNLVRGLQNRRGFDRWQASEREVQLWSNPTVRSTWGKDLCA
ncbi:hypothetical protein F5Y15DRAFT_425707 [Xylariaceae sp. FL0016]|nr:hypothetical protein F5Y15DRAFT_425707 [Xylariaceae sp. FL0016]